MIIYRLICVLFVSLFLLMSCQEKAKETFIQGRVIDYDINTNQVKIIRDANNDMIKPNYNTLPLLTFELPKDIIPKGSEPTDGYRINTDAENGVITVYDPQNNIFKDLKITIVDKVINVQRDDPLVFDKNTKSPVKFPIIEKDKKTITLYSQRQKIYLKFKVDETLFELPEKAWRAGDDIKISTKDNKKITTYTNLTKSDILNFKAQK
ncbi:MAG: DUF4881 domain-containing protein [Thermodesulfovibrionales bacterium]|nr:DUF4881 domain-containing protein [Thermodesulfovibrionales bacterium]